MLTEVSPTILEIATPAEREELFALMSILERGEGQAYTFSDLKIRTKDKQLVTFVPNDVQVAYLDMLTDTYVGFDWRNGVYTLRGAREDVLKARQQGLSTLWLALYFLDTINHPLTQTIIIADNGERSEMLFKICHRFWEHLPADRRPKKKYSSKRELEFTDLDSVIYVGTAGQGTVGRGGTINNVLESERAYWANGDDVEAGLMESVPQFGNVTRETTANGLNEYYNERQAQHKGDSPFRPRFFGWNLTREYRHLPSLSDPTEEERQLSTAYGLDAAQLAWRREKLRTLKDRFPQEYPLTEEEAFISSGDPFFDRARLMTFRGRLEEVEPISITLSPTNYSLLREAQRRGELTLWAPPNPDHWYIVSADPAEGITRDKKRDFCSADVLDAQTWEQVGHLYGKWEPHTFGLMLAELGWLYNTALLGVLRLNHGHAVMDAIQYTANYPIQIGVGTSGLYFFDPKSVTGQRTQQEPEQRQRGWPENVPAARAFMYDKLKEAVSAEPGIVINSLQTIAEMLTYVDLPGGLSGGEAGTHDDCVSSLALGCALLNLRFERRRRQPYEEIEQEPAVMYGQDNRAGRRGR